MTTVLLIDEWPGIDMLKVSGAGLGSSLFKLAAFNDAFEQGYEIHLLTSNSKKELLSGSKTLKRIYCSPSEIVGLDFEKVVLLGIREEQLTEAHFNKATLLSYNDQDKKKYKSSAHIVFWVDYLANKLGYRPTDKAFQFPLGPINSMRKKGKIVGISYQTISRLKHFKKWEQVISALISSDPNLSVYLLGYKKTKVNFPKQVTSMLGESNISQLKEIIHSCDVVVGVDSLIVNLAMVLKIPTVALFTMIDPNWIVDPNQHNRSQVITMTHGQCPHQYCYTKIDNYRSSDCMNNATQNENDIIECLDFKADNIVANVLSLLKY